MIGAELARAKCVVVIWSPNSVGSHWVLDEAGKGRERGILVPVLIEGASAPLGFGQVQAVDLSGWMGRSDDPRLLGLFAGVLRVLAGKSPPQYQAPPPARMGRMRSAMRHRATWTVAAIAGLGAVGLTILAVRNAGDRQRDADAEMQWQKVRDSTDSYELEAFEKRYQGTYYGSLAKARLENFLGPSQDGWTLGGDYLRYYPSPSPGACRLDCERNPSGCKGFTWVRPGGYQAGDGPMCYLITSVQGPTQHKCCVSASRGPFPFPQK